MSCGAGTKTAAAPAPATPTPTAPAPAPAPTPAPTPAPPPPPAPAPSTVSGVLRWKGDASGSGNYGSETTLTPANVTVAQFGKLAQISGDGNVLAQPLYVSGLDMGAKGKHNVVIFATESNSVYAFDADNPSAGSLWERHYNVNGATSAPENFGGRTAIGSDVGITGTPVIDPATGAMYFVTMQSESGTIHQRLRAVDVRTGNDFGTGQVDITASVSGNGRANVNGTISFDPTIQNQRAGLSIINGKVVIAWGSFSDQGLYHGWLMAYDAAALTQKAVFNTANQYQAQDSANGPADHGGGAAVWMGGAAPSIDAAGNFYVVAADGSFNADQGGTNYGDTVLKLSLDDGGFHVVDYFTPSNQACVDQADLEIGSGGVALLPGMSTGLAVNKEGKMYAVNTGNMGHYSPTSDAAQVIQVGANTCFANMGGGFAEGTNWQRLYGNPSFWNGNIYLAPSNGPLMQYQMAGAAVNSTPVKKSGTMFGTRGANTVVSSNGAQNAIVWAYQKNPSQGRGELHAYDATDVSHELWNSAMNAGRDQMGAGFGFGTPVVVNGKVFAPTGSGVAIYGLLK